MEILFQSWETKKKRKQKEKKVRMKLFLDIPCFVYFKIRIKLI